MPVITLQAHALTFFYQDKKTKDEAKILNMIKIFIHGQKCKVRSEKSGITILSIQLFHRCGNWGPEKSCSILRVTEYLMKNSGYVPKLSHSLLHLWLLHYTDELYPWKSLSSFSGKHNTSSFLLLLCTVCTYLLSILYFVKAYLSRKLTLEVSTQTSPSPGIFTWEDLF